MTARSKSITCQSSDEPSPQRQLIDRLRFILAIIATMASALRRSTSCSPPTIRSALFFAFRVARSRAGRCSGSSCCASAWAEPWAWPLAIAIVTFAYLFVAAAGVASPTGEYVTTAFLFVGAALLTATVLPWGLAPQCVTVGGRRAGSGGGDSWTDGTLAALTTDPAAVVMMGFVLSARDRARVRALPIGPPPRARGTPPRRDRGARAQRRARAPRGGAHRGAAQR